MQRHAARYNIAIITALGSEIRRLTYRLSMHDYFRTLVTAVAIVSKSKSRPMNGRRSLRWWYIILWVNQIVIPISLGHLDRVVAFYIFIIRLRPTWLAVWDGLVQTQRWSNRCLAYLWLYTMMDNVFCLRLAKCTAPHNVPAPIHIVILFGRHTLQWKLWVTTKLTFVYQLEHRIASKHWQRW